MKSLIGLIAFAALLLGQDAVPATGSLEGSVVDSVTGVAVPGVQVSLDNHDGTVHNGLTNEAGTFRIEGLSPGVYGSRFVKPGYVPLDSRAEGASLKPIIVEDDAGLIRSALRSPNSPRCAAT
jgi:hypothetical protein